MRFLLIGEGTALVHNIALQILDGFLIKLAPFEQ